MTEAPSRVATPEGVGRVRLGRSTAATSRSGDRIDQVLLADG